MHDFFVRFDPERASDDVRRRFYCDNFLALMGSSARHLATATA